MITFYIYLIELLNIMDFLKSDKKNQVTLAVSFIIGVTIGYFLNSHNKKPSTKSIDHLVIKSYEKTEECIKFYEVLGLTKERYDRWAHQAKLYKGKDKRPNVFPNMRVNEGSIIDLLPENFKPYNDSEGNTDHFCLAMTAEEHLECLKNLKEAGHSVVNYGKRYGSKGTGFSSVHYDPTGFKVELRNID